MTWALVDFNNRIIKVEQQRQYIPGKGIVEGDPKSDSGVRLITMSELMTCTMKDYKRHQLEMKIKCGSAWIQSDYVFTHDDGKPIFPHRPSQWFSELIKRKNLPHITFHGLRHTNASLSLAGGVDIVTLSTRLGHADKNVTLNTYSHIIRSREKLAANKMDAFYESSEALKNVLKKRNDV